MPRCNAGDMRRSFDNLKELVHNGSVKKQEGQNYWQSLKTDRVKYANVKESTDWVKRTTSQQAARRDKQANCDLSTYFDYMGAPSHLDNQQRATPFKMQRHTAPAGAKRPSIKDVQNDSSQEISVVNTNAEPVPHINKLYVKG